MSFEKRFPWSEENCNEHRSTAIPEKLKVFEKTTESCANVYKIPFKLFWHILSSRRNLKKELINSRTTLRKLTHTDHRKILKLEWVNEAVAKVAHEQ